MKRLITTLCLILYAFPAFSGEAEFIKKPSYSEDFSKGLSKLKNEDVMTSFKELKILAERGDSKSQNDIGVMYYFGDGVIHDYIYSFMWLSISGSNGYDEANKNIKIIKEIMTPSQIEKAQDLARECMKKNYKGC